MSASQACGSTSLSQTVPMSVYITAARKPRRSEPADNQLRLPGAIPRRALSTALLVRQMAPIAITFVDAFGAADGASQEHVTGVVFTSRSIAGAATVQHVLLLG